MASSEAHRTKAASATCLSFHETGQRRREGDAATLAGPLAGLGLATLEFQKVPHNSFLHAPCFMGGYGKAIGAMAGLYMYCELGDKGIRLRLHSQLIFCAFCRVCACARACVS